MLSFKHKIFLKVCVNEYNTHAFTFFENKSVKPQNRICGITKYKLLKKYWYFDSEIKQKQESEKS